ncbi:hypothetical protein T484DRAFT_1629981, partial [Baffinella frigidus]
PQPETRNPKPETRNPKPETRNPKPETRNPKPETRTPRPETRNLKTETRNPKPPAGRGTTSDHHPDPASNCRSSPQARSHHSRLAVAFALVLQDVCKNSPKNILRGLL